MAILNKGTTYKTGDIVTADNLNDLVGDATFVSGAGGATDDSSLTVSPNGNIEVKDGGISTAKLVDSAVTGAKIADGTISQAKLSFSVPDGVTPDGTTIELNTSGEFSLKDDGVSTAKILDSAVTGAKIADGTISQAKLNFTPGGGGTSETVDDVTIERNATSSALQVKDGGIATAKISDSAVTGAKIADGTISSAKLNFTPGSNETVDDVTIERNATSSALQVKDGGITDAKIASSFIKNEPNDVTTVDFVRKLTQTEFDAIASPSNNTLYIIV